MLAVSNALSDAQTVSSYKTVSTWRPRVGLGRPGELLDDALDRIVESLPGRFGARRLPHQSGPVPVGMARDDGVQQLAAPLLRRDGLLPEGRRASTRPSRPRWSSGQIQATAQAGPQRQHASGLFSRKLFFSAHVRRRVALRGFRSRPALLRPGPRPRPRRAPPAARAGASTSPTPLPVWNSVTQGYSPAGSALDLELPHDAREPEVIEPRP